MAPYVKVELEFRVEVGQKFRVDQALVHLLLGIYVGFDAADIDISVVERGLSGFFVCSAVAGDSGPKQDRAIVGGVGGGLVCCQLVGEKGVGFLVEGAVWALDALFIFLRK